MSTSIGDVVLPPATDRPALSDPTTATLLTVVARKVKGTVSGFGLAPLLAVSFGSMVMAGPVFSWPIVILTGLVIVGIAIVLGQATYAHVRFGRWLPSARRLLAAQAWRPVPATVLRPGSVVRGTVVEVLDGGHPSHLRTVGLYSAVGQVIARTGRVWLVGPDAKGRLALRVDGVHAPWPARLIRTRPAPRRPAVSVQSGSTGTAADDPVVAAWALTVAWLVLLRLWLIVSLIAAFALTAVPLAILTGTVTPWVVFALVFSVPCLIVMLVRLRRSRDVLALPRLLRAGPWTRVGVRVGLGIFGVRPTTGVADASGTVLLDNGTTLAVMLPAASVDLLGNIWETGTVWLAGEPASGRTLAVGFPGYPVLGVARFP